MKSLIQKMMTASLALAVVSGGLASTEALAKKKKIGMIVFDVVGKAEAPRPTEADDSDPQASAQTQPTAACNPNCPPQPAGQVTPRPGQSEPTRPDPK